MIALRTQVLAGVVGEIGEVIGREPINGGLFYRVRFPGGRVRCFASRWVRVAVAPVVRMPVRLRLVVDNERRV